VVFPIIAITFGWLAWRLWKGRPTSRIA
jgi:hypothetical protein